jgi:hypothetical protein
MLYIGADEELPLLSSPDLKVEQVEPVRQAVRQWFSQPVVQFVGAHTGCSCGFPSVTAEPPKGVIDWQLTALDPDRLFFNERFMHVVQNREPAGARK